METMLVRRKMWYCSADVMDSSSWSILNLFCSSSPCPISTLRPGCGSRTSSFPACIASVGKGSFGQTQAPRRVVGFIWNDSSRLYLVSGVFGLRISSLGGLLCRGVIQVKLRRKSDRLGSLLGAREGPWICV